MCLPKSLGKFPSFNGLCKFYQEKSWREVLGLLDLIRKHIYTMRFYGEKAEKCVVFGEGKDSCRRLNLNASFGFQFVKSSSSASCEIFTELKHQLKWI